MQRIFSFARRHMATLMVIVALSLLVINGIVSWRHRAGQTAAQIERTLSTFEPLAARAAATFDADLARHMVNALTALQAIDTATVINQAGEPVAKAVSTSPHASSLAANDRRVTRRPLLQESGDAVGFLEIGLKATDSALLHRTLSDGIGAWIKAVLIIAALVLARSRDALARSQRQQAPHPTKRELTDGPASPQVITSVCHDLRTPLNSILGFAQLLPRASTTDTRNRYASHILDAGEHMAALIDNLLALTQTEGVHLRLESIDLNTLARQCVEMSAPLASQNEVTLTASLAETPVMVCIDQTRLKRTLINLISNAIKYNRRGGRASVIVEHPGPDIRRITVVDDGIGINRSQLKEIFKPYARSDRARAHAKGMGIGLAVARRMVQRMGGEIYVDSTPGAGSCFWIDLPAGGERKRAAC